MTDGQLTQSPDGTHTYITGGGATSKVATEELEERTATLDALQDLVADLIYRGAELWRPGPDSFRLAPEYARSLNRHITDLSQALRAIEVRIDDTRVGLAGAIDTYMNADQKAAGLLANLRVSPILNFIFAGRPWGFGDFENLALGLLFNRYSLPFMPKPAKKLAPHLATLFGWMRGDGPIQVRPVSTFKDVPVAMPVGFEGAAQSITLAQPNMNPLVPSSSIVITTIRKPDGTVCHLVSIPGTQDANPTPFGSKTNVLDLEAIFQNLIGEDSDLSEAIKTAMEMHGIQPDEEVVLTGHSLGGMAAVTMLRDKQFMQEFDVLGAVPFGAPLGAVPTDLLAPVLAVEHADDLLVNAEGLFNPAHDNLTTVWFNPPGIQSPISAHGMSSTYIGLGERTDNISGSPQVDHAREVFAPVLNPGAGTAVATAYQIQRLPNVPTVSAPPSAGLSNSHSPAEGNSDLGAADGGHEGGSSTRRPTNQLPPQLRAK